MFFIRRLIVEVRLSKTRMVKIKISDGGGHFQSSIESVILLISLSIHLNRQSAQCGGAFRQDLLAGRVGHRHSDGRGA